MGIYSFDVGLSSHDLLKLGHTTYFWTRVVLEAEDDVDAHLLAARFAHGMHPDLMVTEVFMDEFPMVGQ